MKRRKRFSIRLVALGFAIAAIAAPTAQAVPLDPDTNRVEHPGLYASAVDDRIISPDDRVAHATWTSQPAVAADDGDGFGTTSIVSGLMLLLVGSFGVALVARSVRKGRLAPA